MTIDKAIAEAESRRENPMQPMWNYDAMKNFYAMCAAALRLAKAILPAPVETGRYGDSAPADDLCLREENHD